MAVFYLLPPREMVAQRWAAFWKSVLPGAELPLSAGHDWPELIAEAAESQGDKHVVFRDELADLDDPSGSLRDGFGAEDGDQLVEVRWTEPTRPPTVRVSRLGASGYNEPVVTDEPVTISGPE